MEEGDVPRSIKRKAIDALHLRNRATEEKEFVQREMSNMNQHLQQQHAFLQASKDDANHPGVNAVIGGSMMQLRTPRGHEVDPAQEDSV